MKVHFAVSFVTVHFAFCHALPAISGYCPSSPIATSANDFGFELIKRIDGQENLFISSFSIYTALALVLLGAGGRTAEEIEAVFKLRSHFLTNSQFHETFESFINDITKRNDAYSFLLANGIFVQKGFPLTQAYIKNAYKFYQASVAQVDFISNPKGTTKKINDWVAYNTRNKIQDILPQPLNPDTVLALLNAIYFKGTWETSFNSTRTFKDLFYGMNGAKRVDYMQHKGHEFLFLEDKSTGYKFLELPYKKGHATMLLALPPPGEFQPDLQMTSSQLCRISSNLIPSVLETVTLPKFTLKYRKELKEDLFKLGIKEIFAASANFTSISKEGSLAVTRVEHAAVIEVNEEGSEAAAATAIIFSRKKEYTKRTFIANRPFLFYIMDLRTGLVLFSGRVVEPE